MNRGSRIAVELLGPPLVAAIIYSTAILALSRDAIVVKAFVLILLFAYIFALIPSLLFTVAMEISFARGLEVRSWRTPLLAAFLGTISGAVIALAWARGFDNSRGAFSLFPALGFITGGLIGLVIRGSSKERSTQASEPATDG